MSAPGPVRRAAARVNGETSQPVAEHMPRALPTAAPKSTRQSQRARRLQRAAELRRLADELDENSAPTEAQAKAIREAAADHFWYATGVFLGAFGLAFSKDGTRDTSHASGFCFDEDGARAVRQACQAVVASIFEQTVVAGSAARERSSALRAQAARLDDAVQRCLSRAATVDKARGAA